MRRVKIVCTLGPSTAGIPKLVEMIQAGMDVARLNFSHGDHETHRKMYQDVREAAAQVGKPIAVLGDLCGPKIRVGQMQKGGVPLIKDKEIILTHKEVVGTPERVSHSYGPLARDVKPGDRILFDDGLLEVAVESIEGEDVRCRVAVGGTLKDHKGMNLPGSKLSTPALTEKDKIDILFGKEIGVDYFALSFVRTPEDVQEAKTLAGEIPVIAKIEKPEAISKLDAILDAADGAMVARGDLGVEAGHEKVPILQKRIINEIRPRAKPVITATQMLDSMIHNPRPTRAEVSDVANAVLDGTDAVMLSAETSAGEYPVEAIKTLKAIIEEIENSAFYSRQDNSHYKVKEKTFTFSNAIADAATEIGRHLNVAAIAVYTDSGKSGALISAHRPKADVISFSRNEKVLNKLSLFWGIHPVHGDWVKGVIGVIDQAEEVLLKRRLVKPGDDIVVTFGMTIHNEPFQTNILKIWKVRGKPQHESHQKGL